MTSDKGPWLEIKQLSRAGYQERVVYSALETVIPGVVALDCLLLSGAQFISHVILYKKKSWAAK